MGSEFTRNKDVGLDADKPLAAVCIWCLNWCCLKNNQTQSQK